MIQRKSSKAKMRASHYSPPYRDVLHITAIPSLWKVRIGGMSEGRGKERKYHLLQWRLFSDSSFFS